MILIIIESMMKPFKSLGKLLDILKEHSGELFHQIDHLTHLSCKLVSTIGILILVTAVLLALVNIKLMFLNTIFGFEFKMSSLSYGGKPSRSRKVVTFGRIRQQLGEITALGLEVLVVSDILETLTKPVNKFSWEDLGKIIVIACLRTLLSIMLGKEIKEIEEKIEETELSASQEMWKLLKSTSTSTSGKGKEKEKGHHDQKHDHNHDHSH